MLEKPLRAQSDLKWLLWVLKCVRSSKGNFGSFGDLCNSLRFLLSNPNLVVGIFLVIMDNLDLIQIL